MMLKDIILVPNNQAIPAARLPSLPVNLGRGVALEKLPQDLAKRVMDACEPPGWNAPPAQGYGDLYAFVRQDPPGGSTPWDPDGRLQECIAISRLIRPTSIGFKYSAQLRRTLDGELKSIFPGPVDGFGAYAWIVQTNHDWLDQTDVTALGELWRRSTHATH